MSEENQVDAGRPLPRPLCVVCKRRPPVTLCSFVLGWEPDNHVLGQAAYQCDAPMCTDCAHRVVAGWSMGPGCRLLTRDYCPWHASKILAGTAEITRDVLTDAEADARRWWLVTEEKPHEAQTAPK